MPLSDPATLYAAIRRTWDGTRYDPAAITAVVSGDPEAERLWAKAQRDAAKVKASKPATLLLRMVEAMLPEEAPVRRRVGAVAGGLFG